MPVLTILRLRRVTPPRVTRTAVESVCPGGLEIRANGGDHEADMLSDHEATLAAGAELVKAAAGGDRAAMATLESDDPVVEADRRVRDYGMTVCGGEG